MIPWSGSMCQETESPDEAVLVMSCRQSVLQVCNAPHIDDKERHNRPCMVFTEDENLKNDSIMLENTLQLKEPCFRFHNQDYVEKIKEFQFYFDMVQKIARPGCSPETLNVALSSLSSLVQTLSAISSKQHIHASL